MSDPNALHRTSREMQALFDASYGARPRRRRRRVVVIEKPPPRARPWRMTSDAADEYLVAVCWRIIRQLGRA